MSSCAISPTSSTWPSPTTLMPTAKDRHAGRRLPNFNHLAVCISYLFGGARLAAR
jgi:hypothetical protein